MVVKTIHLYVKPVCLGFINFSKILSHEHRQVVDAAMHSG